MSSNPMDNEVARLLAEGQAAARRGDRPMARTLLTQLVDRDPQNEEAWMWLSGVVTDPSEQQICLENVLVVNPYNAQARKGLEFLTAKTGLPSRIPPAPQPPTYEQVMASSQPAPAPQTADLNLDQNGNPPWLQDVNAQPGAPVMPGFPDSQATDSVPAATDAPPSWAVPGPEPADPFVATVPYPASPEANGANGMNGANGSDYSADVTDTVHYVASEPAPTDTSLAPGMMAEHHDDTTGGMVNGNGHYPPDSADQAEGMNASMQGDFDEAQPFVPPGFESAQSRFGSTSGRGGRSSEDTDTDLPSWLEGLTPSPVAPSPDQQPLAPFDPSTMGAAAPDMVGANSGAPAMPAMPGMFDMSNMTPMSAAHDPNMPFGVPGGMPASDMGQMSPFSDIRLPSPHELPGDDGRVSSAPAQPWYLQPSNNNSSPPMPTGGISSYLDSSMLNSSMLGGSGVAVLDDQRTKTAVTVECPNCKEQVPETSLACPNCGYNFFVNCPHCHELVDTLDAVPDKTEPCPYCKGVINKMQLGLGGVADLVSQKNPGSKPASAKNIVVAFPTMEQTIPGLKAPRRGLSFNWVIDLLWLIAVVMMVWALTQLPIWLNLPGMY